MKFLLLTHLNSSKSGLVPELSRVTLSYVVARKTSKVPDGYSRAGSSPGPGYRHRLEQHMQ